MAPLTEKDFNPEDPKQLWPPADFPYSFHPGSIGGTAWLPAGLDRGSLKLENGIWWMFDYGGSEFWWVPFDPAKNPSYQHYADVCHRFPPNQTGRASFGFTHASDGVPEQTYLKDLYNIDVTLESMLVYDFEFGVGRFEALRKEYLLRFPVVTTPPVITPPGNPPPDLAKELAAVKAHLTEALDSRFRIGDAATVAATKLEKLKFAKRGGGQVAALARDLIAAIDKEI